jgi:hypothetical protein
MVVNVWSRTSVAAFGGQTTRDASLHQYRRRQPTTDMCQLDAPWLGRTGPQAGSQ